MPVAPPEDPSEALSVSRSWLGLGLPECSPPRVWRRGGRSTDGGGKEVRFLFERFGSKLHSHTPGSRISPGPLSSLLSPLGRRVAPFPLFDDCGNVIARLLEELSVPTPVSETHRFELTQCSLQFTPRDAGDRKRRSHQACASFSVFPFFFSFCIMD